MPILVMHNMHWQEALQTMKVKAIIPAVFALFSAHAFSIGFSGYTGVLGAYHSKLTAGEEKIDPELLTQSFFTGQFDITGRTFFRADMALATSDILQHSVFESTDAKFKLNELSLTHLMHGTNGAIHALAAFMGTYDPIGSDVFLQRYLGANPISSRLTDSWAGMNGSPIYSYGSIGASYIYRSAYPFAAGAYVYYDKESASDDEDGDGKAINFDIRFACNFRYFTWDIEGGFNFEHEDEVGGEKVIFAVTTANIHAGTSILLGNKSGTALFLQGGFKKISIDPDKDDDEDSKFLDLKAEDMYILGELRLGGKGRHFVFTAFNLPQSRVEEMAYIHDSLGANIAIYSENFHCKNNDFVLGINTMLSFDGKFANDIKDLTKSSTRDEFKESMNLFFSPFFETQVFNGILKINAEINAMHFKYSDKALFHCSLGFKTRL